MKSLKDIEDISLEELEAVSLDESVKVPEGFAERLRENIEAQQKIERLDEAGSAPRTIRLTFISAAASVAVLAGIGFGIARWQNEPKDTFDDPYMAYAELEKAFAKMSESMQKAIAMAEESEVALEKVAEVFE